MSDIVLEDVGVASCEPMAAIATEVLFAERSDFETLVDPKSMCGTGAAATLDELAEIPSPGHVLKAGKKLNKLTIVAETGEVTTTQIGEKKRRLFENQVSIQVAGSSSKLLGFMRWAKNRDLIFLVREVGTGNYRQFGSDLLSAWTESQEHKIEAAAEGNVSATIVIKDKQKWPAPVYKGDVTVEVIP